MVVIGVSNEKWLPAVGYEGLYEVSSLGRARRSAPGSRTYIGKIMLQHIGCCGYMRVGLYKEGVQTLHLVHRLITGAFFGECPDGKEVNHKDGDKTNNCTDNLEYVTRSENLKHAIAIGLLSRRGEKNPQSKLTEDIVRQIRKRALAESRINIANDLGVSISTIDAVMCGQNWGWVK